MTEYVCGFLFSPNRNLVALIRKSHPDWQKGKLNGVGGRVGTVRTAAGNDGPETNFEAIVREFHEEAGVRTFEGMWELKVELVGPDRTVYFFAGHSPEPVGFSVTADEPVGWYDADRLPDDVIPNLRWLIPLCLDPDVTECVTVRVRPH